MDDFGAPMHTRPSL